MGLWAARQPYKPREMRLDISTPTASDPASFAISPDGQNIIFETASGASQLWIRPLNSTSAHPIAQTDGGRFPFWSPDSRSIGFFADGNLKRIDVDGQNLRVLADSASGRGGTWSSEGVIAFAPIAFGTLYRTSANGGKATPITQFAENQTITHRFPQFLPDGQHFLYLLGSSSGLWSIYVGQLDGKQTVHVLDADTAAIYAAPGQLLFVKQGTLFAQNFDYRNFRLSGQPTVVARQMGFETSRLAALSASTDGKIAFHTYAATNRRQFIWFDRNGKELERAAEPDSTNPINPSMSPNGRRIVLERNLGGGANIWVLDLERGVYERLTSESTGEASPVWSPRNNDVVFSCAQNATRDLCLRSVSDSETAKVLISSPGTKIPLDWSKDGRYVLYRTVAPDTALDLWALPMDDKEKPFPVVKTRADDRDGAFSPDGRWIAFESEESGRSEIYVQSFPGMTNKTLISTKGGEHIRWRADGKELFYIGPDQYLVSVAIRYDGQTIEPGKPVPLFQTHTQIPAGKIHGFRAHPYVVSDNGQRFLIDTIVDDNQSSPITLLLNWTPQR
jgi:Tol biopolymer transport system component